MVGFKNTIGEPIVCHNEIAIVNACPPGMAVYAKYLKIKIFLYRQDY
jgi:hypothetical protein